MVTPGVASQDGGVAVGTRLAGRDDLPLERIRQVDQLRLVEFQKSHNRFYLFFIS